MKNSHSVQVPNNT